MVNIKNISKGKNFLERGEQFAECIFGEDILEGDCSKYEGSQRLRLLVHIELTIWKLIDPGSYGLLTKLFRSKMKKSGKTLNELYFEFWYCRGSGDMDTGLFNTLIMFVACRYFEIVNKTGDHNFICDGDDNQIKIPRNISELKDTFKEFGFDAKLIRRHTYHDASYCSGKFIQYKPGKFLYVQDLNKLMNNIPIFRKLKFNHCKGAYYHSLGYMYHKIYGNLPVFREISKFLMNIAPKEHVHMDILEEINPGHAEAFKNTSYNLEYDEDLCKVELAMCFTSNITNLENYSTWYKNHQVSLDKAELKRYNPIKTPRDRLTQNQIEMTFLSLIEGCSAQPPRNYIKNVF